MSGGQGIGRPLGEAERSPAAFALERRVNLHDVVVPLAHVQEGGLSHCALEHMVVDARLREDLHGDFSVGLLVSAEVDRAVRSHGQLLEGLVTLWTRTGCSSEMISDQGV